MEDRSYQQRNRKYKEKPSGSFRTEKYNKRNFKTH